MSSRLESLKGNNNLNLNVNMDKFLWKLKIPTFHHKQGYEPCIRATYIQESMASLRVCNLHTKFHSADFHIHFQLPHKIKCVVKFPLNVLQMKCHMTSDDTSRQCSYED